MEKDKVILVAANTLMGMCVNYISGDLSQGTFTANLERYAVECRKQHNLANKAVQEQIRRFK